MDTVPPPPSTAARLTKLQRAGLIFAAICAFVFAAAIVAAALGPFHDNRLFGTKAHAIGLTAAGVAPILAGVWLATRSLRRRLKATEEALKLVQTRLEELSEQHRLAVADSEARLANTVTEAIRHFGWTTYARGIEDAPSVPGDVIQMPKTGTSSRTISRG